jgi:diguanylate cyclase
MPDKLPAPKSPSDIAREALLRLSQRRVPPTPDNYAAIYSEITGLRSLPAVEVVRILEGLCDELSGRGGALAAPARALKEALASYDAPRIRQSLTVLFNAVADGPDWAPLLSALLRQLEIRHADWTDARKRESLDRLFVTCVNEPVRLHERLHNLIRSWASYDEVPRPDPALVDENASPSPPLSRTDELRLGARQQEGASGNQALVKEVLDLAADLMERGILPRLSHLPHLAAEAQCFVEGARHAAGDNADVAKLTQALHSFWDEFETTGNGAGRVMERLTSVVRLMVENLGGLVSDDLWVAGQVERMRGILTGPITEAALRDVEAAFRRVLYRQARAKQALDEAKQALKDELGAFMERLGSMLQCTGTYQSRLSALAAELSQTADLAHISRIVARLREETDGVQIEMQRNYDALQQARERAAAQEAQVEVLEQELRAISQLVREDGLTHTLNRRGLAEAFVIEAARSERNGTPLCLAILDVDDFKALNDRYGHATGDQALVHLANVARRTLRPGDVIARYGGEEFVILLGDTTIDKAAEIMRRTQRELTRHYFMHENERLLITFSAGVAQWRPGEAQHATIDRADAALYLAKRAGKNQVVQAEVPLGGG